MRLDADHARSKSARWALALALLLAVEATCSKTWVLDADGGAGGSGNMPGPGGGGGGGAPGMPSSSGGFPGSGGRGDVGSGGHVGPSCTPSKNLDYAMPEIAFVVGRNQSMSMKFGDNTSTRMTVVQEAVSELVKDYQDEIEFGYEDFPSLSGCMNGTTCCPSASDQLPPSTNTTPFNYVLYHCDDGGGPRPGCVAGTDSRAIAQTLSSTSELFGPQSTTNSDRYAVLITDGPPGCPTEDPTMTCPTARQAVSKLTGAGIKMYVVAVGDDAATDSCLTTLSSPGAANVQVLSATDQPSLNKALGQIAAMATSTHCTINLTNKPTDPSLVAVLADGKEIRFDPTGTNGWSYESFASTTRIVLHGADCDYVQTPHLRGIVVSYGCPPCTTSSPFCL